MVKDVNSNTNRKPENQKHKNGSIKIIKYIIITVRVGAANKQCQGEGKL